LNCYNKGGTYYVDEFNACVHKYEDEREFEKIFRDLESELGLPWFHFVYKDKKKIGILLYERYFLFGSQKHTIK
jgi:hypothetical protein